MLKLRSTLLLVIPLLITVVNCIQNEKESKQPREFSYLVRICVKSPTRGEYIACLGVYNRIQQILAGKECLDHMRNATVELWMGSRKMDCHSGQRRILWKYHVASTHLIIQPFAGFHLSSKTSSIDQFRRYTLYSLNFLNNCWIFCNWKYLKGNLKGDMGSPTICDNRIDTKKLWPVHCPHEYTYNKMVSFMGSNQNNRVLSHDRPLLEDSHSSLMIAVQGNGRPNRCGFIQRQPFPLTPTNTFYPSLSPVVCDGVLYGFVNVNQSDFSRILYQTIPVVDNLEIGEIRKRKKNKVEADLKHTTVKAMITPKTTISKTKQNFVRLASGK